MLKKYLILSLNLILLSFLFKGCSKNENEPSGTHFVNVVPVPIGLLRLDDINIYISESPFESYATFKPLASVELPKNRKATDPVKIDVSKYIGKTLYFVALRKFLLSDEYYNITTNNNTQLIKNLKLSVTQEKTNYDLSFVINQPTNKDYTPDEARLKMQVRKNNNIASGQKLYYYGLAYNWGSEIIRIIEQRYNIDKSVVYPLMGNTNSSGELDLLVKVNENGVVTTGNNTIDYNEHVFFIIDGGKVKGVKVKIDKLSLSSTLSY